MTRVGEFCIANVARLLLTVFIAVGLVVAIGVWVFYAPPHGTSIEQPKTAVPSQ